MGQPTIGVNGLVTSWGTSGNDVYQLIEGPGCKPFSITFDENSPVLDSTAFASGGVNSHAHIIGLRDWTATISAKYPGTTPAIGNGGLVTFASGDVLHINAWELTIEASEFDITEFAATNRTDRLFRPGPYKWSGSFSGFIDSATATVGTTAAGTAAAAATFKITESGATDSSLGGSILITQVNAAVAVGSQNTKRYSFQGSGDLVHTFPSGLGLLSTSSPYTILPSAWDADADGVPDRTLTWQAYSGRTYAAAAFWKSLSFKVGVGDEILVDIGVRGAGAITRA